MYYLWLNLTAILQYLNGNLLKFMVKRDNFLPISK